MKITNPDNVIEKMAQALKKAQIDGWDKTFWNALAEAALAALEPGDEIGPNLTVTAGETIYSAECQAADEMREACAEAGAHAVEMARVQIKAIDRDTIAKDVHTAIRRIKNGAPFNQCAV
jgi:hypothetical protein